MDEQLWLALKGHALQGRIPSWIIKAIETQDGRDQLNPHVEIKTVTKSYLEFLALQVKLNVSELRVREAKASIEGLAPYDGQEYFQILLHNEGGSTFIGLLRRDLSLLYVKE